VGLSNWDVHRSADTILVQETVGAIRGFGGATFFETSNHTIIAATLTPNNTFPRGFLRGRMRMLVRIDTTMFGGWYFGGVLFKSHDDVTSGGIGRASYLAGLTFGGWIIRKYANGLDVAGVTLASTGANFFPVERTPFALEVHWAYDLLQYGGTSLAVFAGTALDFSDLTLRLTGLDTSNPFSTSVGEGIGHVKNNTTNTQSNSVVDNVSIYKWT